MAQDVGLGMRSYFGFGDESTWGTAVAPTNFIEINSESFAKQVGRIEAQSIIKRGLRNTHVIEGGIAVDGEVSFDAQYDGWLKIAKHAFGTLVTSQPDITNAPTCYQHKFTIADTPLTGMSVEVFRDTSQFVTEPNYAHRYSGCKVARFEMACGVDEILRVTAGFVGKDEGRVAKATDTYNNTKVAVYHQGVVKWNGEDIQVGSFNVQLDNGLGMRPKLGSRYSREPVPDQKLQVSGSFEMEFSSWQQYDDFVNTEQREFRATFEGATIGGSIKQMILLVMPCVIMNNVRVNADQPGRIMLSADFRAYRTESQNELELTVRNESASV
jgi:hypothetical protein